MSKEDEAKRDEINREIEMAKKQEEIDRARRNEYLNSIR